MRNAKRTYKDSLFRDIFNNETRLPEIYEALLGDRVTPEEITLATINETLFTGKATVSLLPKYENKSKTTARSNQPSTMSCAIA